MATNQTLVELVRFTADGQKDVVAATKMIAEASSAAATQHAALAKILADPAFRKAGESLEYQRRATASLLNIDTQRFNLAVRQRALRTGAYAEELKSLRAIGRETARVAELERAQQIRARHADATSGAYAGGLGAKNANDAAERRTARLEERARLAAQRANVAGGGFGRELRDELSLEDDRNAASRAEEHERLVARRERVKSGAYSKEAASLRDLARERERVEQIENRADAVARYGRAGAVMARYGGPAARFGAGAAVGVAGAAVASARSGFSGTVEGNRLAFELKLVSRELAGAFRPAIEIATKSLQNLRRFLERMTPRQQNQAMVAGGGILALAGANLLTKSLFGVGLASAAKAGLRSPLALPAIAVAAGYGKEATAGAAVAGGLLGRIRGTGVLRGAAKFAAPVAALESLHSAGTGGFYSALRGRGQNKLTSAFGALGGGFMDLLSFGRYGDEFRKKYAGQINAGQGIGQQKPAGHRSVTIADAGFEAAGSAYERVTTSMALVDAQTDTRDVLEQIRDILLDAAGLKSVPPPPPLR